MDPEIVRKVEAVLFASGRFINASRIAEHVGTSQKNVNQALDALRNTLVEYGSALQIVEEEGAWKLHVRDEYLEVVSAVVSDTEVSGPVLETLAIIAWRSPVLQSEVVDIRGSNAYEHVKELVERNFITKEPEGRSYRLRITEKFFEYFDVEGRDDIRKVFKEVEEEHRLKEMELELEQKRLQEAIRKAEEGEAAEVDIPEGEEIEIQEKLPDKKVDIDKLDEVLEKSAKTREKVGEDLKALRGSDDDSDESEPSEEGEESDDDPAEETPEKTPEEEPEPSKTKEEPEEPEEQEPEEEPEKKEAPDVPEEEDEDGDDPELSEAKKTRKKVEEDLEDF